MDAAEVEAEVLFARLVAGRIRHPTILPTKIEAAYNASTIRRQKASRKDFAAGFKEGYAAALADLQRDAKEVA